MKVTRHVVEVALTVGLAGWGCWVGFVQGNWAEAQFLVVLAALVDVDDLTRGRGN